MTTAVINDSLMWQPNVLPTGTAALTRTVPVKKEDVSIDTLLAARQRAVEAEARTRMATGKLVGMPTSDPDKIDPRSLSKAQLKSIFGDRADSVKTLIGQRTDLSLGDLLRAQSFGALGVATRLLLARPDINMDDLFVRDASGALKGMNPLLKEPDRVKLLMQRKDITIDGLSQMEDNFKKIFCGGSSSAMASPLAKQCCDQAVELMLKRDDIGPKDLEDILNHSKSTIMGGTSSDEGAYALASMFKDSCDLLLKRKDIKIDDVHKLIDATQYDQNGQPGKPMVRAGRFHELTDFLMENPHVKVDQLLKARQEKLRRQKQQRADEDDPRSRDKGDRRHGPDTGDVGYASNAPAWGGAPTYTSGAAPTYASGASATASAVV